MSAAPWWVVVTRRTLDLDPLPPYVVGPYATEREAGDDASSDSGTAYALLTLDAQAESYIADECYWTSKPPKGGEQIVPGEPSDDDLAAAVRDYEAVAR